jgi:hypothetical protein
MQHAHLLPVGNLYQASPLALAERAIGQTTRISKNARGKYSLTLDDMGFVGICPTKYAPPHMLVATFNRRSDPDWLEEELAFAWKQQQQRYAK